MATPLLQAVPACIGAQLLCNNPTDISQKQSKTQWKNTGHCPKHTYTKLRAKLSVFDKVHS